jgi:uncharacterized SAM-binding protein YcdF (DUF218 family)
MSDAGLSPGQITEVTAYVDIEAPPPDEPTAHLIFGTNQAQPAEIAVERYHRGLAPFVIVTGGVNRHNGIVEGREFHRLLIRNAVPDNVIRVEDRSVSTWQNVEFALPYLREAMALGFALTAVSKWYHRRAIHALRTLLPQAELFYAISWEPIYGGVPITRDSWPAIPDGRRRVIREWQEVPRKVAEGSFRDATKVNGTWK